MIGDLCKKHDCIAVMDEVYEWIFYEGTQHIRMGMLNVFGLNFITLYDYFCSNFAWNVGSNHNNW